MAAIILILATCLVHVPESSLAVMILIVLVLIANHSRQDDMAPSSILRRLAYVIATSGPK